MSRLELSRQIGGRLTSKNRAVKLGVRGHLGETNIGRELISSLDNQDVAGDNIDGHDGDLYAIPDDEALFGNHVFDGCHDAGRRPILPHVEGGLDEPDGNQYNGEGQVGQYRRVAQRAPCDEDEDSADEENGSEALEEVAEPLLKTMGDGRRGHVLSILLGFALDLVLRQTLCERRRQAPEGLVGGYCVPFEVGKICVFAQSVMLNAKQTPD